MRDALPLLRQLASEAAIAAAPYVLEAGVRASNALEALGDRLRVETLEEALRRARDQYAADEQAFAKVVEERMAAFRPAIEQATRHAMLLEHGPAVVHWSDPEPRWGNESLTAYIDKLSELVSESTAVPPASFGPKPVRWCDTPAGKADAALRRAGILPVHHREWNRGE